MSVEANKAAVRRALACVSAGDVDGFTSILAPHYVRHCQAMQPGLQELRGPGAMRGWLLANKASFPDYREELEMLVAEGDCVAWRSVGTGTLLGPMGPFPATGRRMSIAIIGVHRFEDDRIAETWTSWDNVAALSQLGLLPGA
jgi:predicted ester cyclase